MCERLARSLARHLDQAKLSKPIDCHARAIPRECPLQFGQDRLSVFGLLHINEVNDHDATEIAQA